MACSAVTLHLTSDTYTNSIRGSVLCADNNVAHVGFRGGFIFPTFFAGTAFGHAVWRTMNAIPGIESWFGSMPPVLFCMTVAVGTAPRLCDALTLQTHCCQYSMPSEYCSGESCYSQRDSQDAKNPLPGSTMYSMYRLVHVVKGFYNLPAPAGSGNGCAML